MKKVLGLLIIISMVLLVVGCSEKKVQINKLGDIIYIDNYKLMTMDLNSNKMWTVFEKFPYEIDRAKVSRDNSILAVNE